MKVINQRKWNTSQVKEKKLTKANKDEIFSTIIK